MRESVELLGCEGVPHRQHKDAKGDVLKSRISCRVHGRKGSAWRPDQRKKPTIPGIGLAPVPILTNWRKKFQRKLNPQAQCLHT